MSDFMENEAMEDNSEDDSDKSGRISPSQSVDDDHSKKSNKSKNKKSVSKLKNKIMISSDEDEDEEEEEDEDKAREDMKGFIADDDEQSASGSSSSSYSSSSETSEKGRHRRKRKKKHRKEHHHQRHEEDEEIDEEDMELLQENLGIKIQKKRKRIKMDDSDGTESSDDGQSKHPGMSGSKSQKQSSSAVYSDSENEDERRRGAGDSSAKHRGLNDDHRSSNARDEYEEEEEEEDVNDFIVDEDGQPISTQGKGGKGQKNKRKHIFGDSARQMAEDIFGVAFDYDTFNMEEKERGGGRRGGGSAGASDDDVDQNQDDYSEDEGRSTSSSVDDEEYDSADDLIDDGESEEGGDEIDVDAISVSEDSDLEDDTVSEPADIQTSDYDSDDSESRRSALNRKSSKMEKAKADKLTEMRERRRRNKKLAKVEKIKKERREEKRKKAREVKRKRRRNRRKAKRKANGLKKKTIFDLYEPHELELRHFTDFDNEVRNADIPERMQVRSYPVEPLPESADAMTELRKEASWIFKYGFAIPTLSSQELHTQSECLERWQRNEMRVVPKIQKCLEFIRQQFHEVPFIAFYRKEYVFPELKINDLWRVYYMDECWCKLSSRKNSYKKLVQRMKSYLAELVMNPSTPHSIQNGEGGGETFFDDKLTLSDEYIKNIDSIESYEELNDLNQQFKLYYGHRIEDMLLHDKMKKSHSKRIKKLLTKTRTIRVKKRITTCDEQGNEVTDNEAPSDYEDQQESYEIEEYVNEEGSEMPSTGMTSDQHVDTQDDILKAAKRNDPHQLCVKWGVQSFANKMGLSAYEFAQNLHDGYQKIDVRQEQIDPTELASKHCNDRLETPNEMLKAATFMLATQISREPLVRKVAREAFHDRATISVTPTKAGLHQIDENHVCGPFKFLKDKPIRTLEGDTWLKLMQAEESKLVTIQIGENLSSLNSSTTFLGEAQELFKHDAFSRAVQEWNHLRAACVMTAFNKMLYPMLRKEIRLKLEREAKDGVIRGCRGRLYDCLRIAPFSVDFSDEDQDDWDSSSGVRVLSISYSDVLDEASYAVMITPEGDAGDFLRLEHITKRVFPLNQNNGMNKRQNRDVSDKEDELDTLQEFIINKRPHVVAIGARDRTALILKTDIENVINKLVEGPHQFPKLQVVIIDDDLAKVYANSKRAETDFRDYPNLLRQSISLGRRLQDPLVEFSQLTGPENEILCLRFHPLQDMLAEEDLLNGLYLEFVNRTNEVGVDVNECLLHPFTSNLVQFVGGLGPRKSAALLKSLRQNHTSQRLENRQQLVTICKMGPKVLINCAGFIKIDTTTLGDSEVYVEILDGSRIHNEAYEWARKMAVDALEYDDEDLDNIADGNNPANALEEIIQEPDKLAELDLDAFAAELERQGFGKKQITLQDIRAELHDMYKDLRDPFPFPQPPEQIFSLLTKETPQTLHVGKLVQAFVTGFVYKKPAAEELDQAAPIRVDQNPQAAMGDVASTWQCPFCVKSDFLELTEVWNHFDAGTCPGRAMGVRIRIETGVTGSSGLSGFISIKNLSDSESQIVPEKRVRVGQQIYCRISRINVDKFSIDAISKSSVLLDKSDEWKRRKDDFYDSKGEKEMFEKEKKVKAAKSKKQMYINRVIVHPAFKNIGFKEAERLLCEMDQGEGIIRPSSKGPNNLTLSWKVTDEKCSSSVDDNSNNPTAVFQHVDIREEDKANAFSLGQSLWIGDEQFEDLDEIIARYLNPIAGNARSILSFKYYRSAVHKETGDEAPSSTNVDSSKKENNAPNINTSNIALKAREKAEAILKSEKKSQPNKIHYILSASRSLPSKFMLSYMPRTKARHEFVTCIPEGFRYRSRVFHSIPSLIKYFKEHFQDMPPPPAKGGLNSHNSVGNNLPPGTPGGRSISGGITPGAMSVAMANTPYGGATPGGGYSTIGSVVNTPYTPSGRTPFMTPYHNSANTPGRTTAPGTPHSTRSGSSSLDLARHLKDAVTPGPYPSRSNSNNKNESSNHLFNHHNQGQSSRSSRGDQSSSTGQGHRNQTSRRHHPPSSRPDRRESPMVGSWNNGATPKGGERGKNNFTPKSYATPLYDE